jgi:hypothetical protein
MQQDAAAEVLAARAELAGMPGDTQDLPLDAVQQVRGRITVARSSRGRSRNPGTLPPAGPLASAPSEITCPR